MIVKLSLVPFFFKRGIYFLTVLLLKVGVGYTGGHFIETITLCWGPPRMMYYRRKIMEQKFLKKKNQISAFAPQKTTLN